jgi:pseudouridine kinase
MDISAKAFSVPTAGDSTPGRIQYSPGGVGRNLAENLARLGVPVQLLSVVGDDSAGRQLLAHTAAAGVDVAPVVVIPGRGTATYLSMHGPDGEVAMAVNDMEILEALTPAVCTASPALQDPRALLLLDCNLPPPTLACLLGMGRRVVADGVSVAKCRRLETGLRGMYLLKLNHLEAAALTGLPVQSPLDCVAAAQHLLDQGVERAVVSFGAAGLAWAQQGEGAFFRAARGVRVVSSTGAGDALLAGVVAALQCGQPMPLAVAYGMACAEITLSSTFANSPDLSDAAVRHQLRNHE